MLACARIGAPHTVVFGGFSAEALRDRINDAEAKVLITADGGYRRGKPWRSSPLSTRRLDASPTIEHVLVVRAHRAATVAWNDARDVWWHDIVEQAADDCTSRSRWTASTCSSSSTRRARPAKPKGILHTTGGYLTQAAYTHYNVFDLKPDGRLLVHRRRRLGHRPLLHRLRPARQRRHAGDVRGHARLPRQGPLVGDRREVRRHDPLHGADRDPHVHEVGRRVPGAARPLARCACSARSASRSTPRRGSGTTSTSAATAARSSTPGGRPRPARS